MMSKPGPEIDPCWGRIGVRGTGACPELAQHVHCHHCPVFHRAARSRLESVPPEGYLESLSPYYTEPRKDRPAGERSMVVFRLDAEWFGLSTRAVTEVIQDQVIHGLPHTRSATLRGLINYRGELTVCLSLEAILNMPRSTSPPMKADSLCRMMVLSVSQGPVAVRVSEVAGMERFRVDQGVIPPATLVRGPVSCVDRLYPWRDGQLSGLDEVHFFDLMSRNLS
jgi:chemotaxis-related protein WspD